MRTNLAVTLAMLGLLAVGSVSALNVESHAYKTIPARRDIKKGAFGSVEITEIFEATETSSALVLKTVHLSRKDFIRDYER